MTAETDKTSQVDLAVKRRGRLTRRYGRLGKAVPERSSRVENDQARRHGDQVGLDGTALRASVPTHVRNIWRNAKCNRPSE